MVKEPESMEELVYFTNRFLGNGSIKVWVYRKPCSKCGKALMAKPKDEKTGKAKIRAPEYACPACKYIVPKLQYEDTLEAEAIYICPECGKKFKKDV